MIDRGLIGFVSKPRRIAVEATRLKFFAQVTGEKNPIYFDANAARRAGHPAILAPPTFVFSLSLGAPIEEFKLEAIGVDVRRLLHAEQRFKNHHPIYAGDVITLTTQISDVYYKKNGQLEFLAMDTDAVNEHDYLCTQMRVVVVIRHEGVAGNVDRH